MTEGHTLSGAAWESVRRAIRDAAGGFVEFRADSLPIDIDRLHFRVLDFRVRAAEPGAPLCLRDVVSLGCTSEGVVELGLFVLASVLHERFDHDVILGVDASDQEWKVRVELDVKEAVDHCSPESVALACFHRQPYVPIDDVSVYVSRPSDWRLEDEPSHSLVIRGSLPGLCSFGGELVRFSDAPLPTESRISDMVTSSDSADVRFRVCSADDLVAFGNAADDRPDDGETDSVAPETAAPVESALARFEELVDAWLGLDEYETLTVELQRAPTVLSSGLRIGFAGRSSRGGFVSTAVLHGSPRELTAFGLWCATAAVSFQGEVRLLTRGGAQIALQGDDFVDASGARHRLHRAAVDEVDDLTAAGSRNVQLSRWYAPEGSGQPKDHLADLFDADGPMNHVLVCGSIPDLADLAGAVMSVAAAAPTAPVDLSSFVSPDHLIVNVSAT